MGPLRLPYCPLEPTAKQEFFLRRSELEVFTGGSAGGGKTLALLAAALQYCDLPGYSALLLRPALTEFYIPGGLHELAQDWLGGHASWIGGPLPQWRFPSGATLTYGYLSSTADIDRYKGGELHYIGFDELVAGQATFVVIPGRAEAADPESRCKRYGLFLDSGFARFARAPE